MNKRTLKSKHPLAYRFFEAGDKNYDVGCFLMERKSITAGEQFYVAAKCYIIGNLLMRGTIEERQKPTQRSLTSLLSLLPLGERIPSSNYIEAFSDLTRDWMYAPDCAYNFDENHYAEIIWFANRIRNITIKYYRGLK